MHQDCSRKASDLICGCGPAHVVRVAGSLGGVSSVTAMAVVPSARVRPLPNNLGATLLIAIGVLTTPLVLGVPLVLVGLALVRTSKGRLAWPNLAIWRLRLQRGWRLTGRQLVRRQP
jgi:hypothetical protein